MVRRVKVGDRVNRKERLAIFKSISEMYTVTTKTVFVIRRIEMGGEWVNLSYNGEAMRGSYSRSSFKLAKPEFKTHKIKGEEYI